MVFWLAFFTQHSIFKVCYGVYLVYYDGVSSLYGYATLSLCILLSKHLQVAVVDDAAVNVEVSYHFGTLFAVLLDCARCESGRHLNSVEDATWDTESPYQSVLIQVPPVLLSQLPAHLTHPGMQQMRTHIPGFLLPASEAWIEFRASAFGLARPSCWAFRE